MKMLGKLKLLPKTHQ